jgi:ComF family protein
MLLTRAANLIYDSVLSVLYPQVCAVCGGIVSARADGVACDECWSKSRFITSENTVCWKCGVVLLGHASTLTSEELTGVRCGKCDELEFSVARACGFYESALRAAVISLKREPHLCSRLGDRLREIHARAPLNTATIIMPVPLHPERQKSRGFNQATVIGERLSRCVKLPLDDSTLIRTVHSERHRAGMDAAARQDSVAGVFEVKYPRRISNERVLLVDDVFTTGATASACARVLRDAGAAEVFVLTLARPVS